ncbi:MAG: hypothetical protein WB565_10270 [Acidimicrobiales bacterium]
MSWRVFLTDSLQSDLDQLTDEERSNLNEIVMTWVESGPPRTISRMVAGIEMFDERVGPDLLLTYYVSEEADLVAVIRIRRRGE